MNDISVKQIVILIALFLITVPLVNEIFFGQIDMSQYFVPQVFREDDYDIVDLSDNSLIYEVDLESNNLVGFDIYHVEGDEMLISTVVDGTKIIDNQSFKNNGTTSRVTKVRHNKVEKSDNKILQVEFVRQSDTQIRYSKVKNCTKCTLVISNENINGNPNIVPVYDIETTSRFRTVFDRVVVNLRFML
jgi:hypothetical protein